MPKKSQINEYSDLHRSVLWDWECDGSHASHYCAILGLDTLRVCEDFTSHNGVRTHWDEGFSRCRRLEPHECKLMVYTLPTYMGTSHSLGRVFFGRLSHYLQFFNIA